MLKSIVIAIGAVVTIASAAVTALRLHTAAVRVVPWVRLPAGSVILVGAAAGMATVVLWFIP